MDLGQEEMKAQVGSLTSWISVNLEEVKVMVDACLENMQANPEEKEAIAEVPNEEAAEETIRTGI